nr:MAG TPA: hypothetical protein [Caudoviricetes sp.]
MTACVQHNYFVSLNENADYARSIFLAGWHLSDEAKFVDRRNRPAAGDELSVGCGRHGPGEPLMSGGEPETGGRY